MLIYVPTEQAGGNIGKEIKGNISCVTPDIAIMNHYSSTTVYYKVKQD